MMVKSRTQLMGCACLISLTVWAKDDGSILPFPPQPSAGVTKARLQDSTMQWPKAPSRLPADAPNILIVMLDDVGFGISETFGGEIHTPTFDRLAKEGIRYNTFHTTSICSPTRAALLTGRNHTRVGSGTIAERAVAFDGYTGVIPKTAATIAEVLKNYGYKTSAFGKWHNTPTLTAQNMGPKDHWPNGYGFEYFYGFLAGETSQYEPRLFENYNTVEPDIHDPTYHLTEDMVDKALDWIDDQQAFTPDHPFLMYWVPGAVHGPHHVFKQWADKYKGKFDDGWDAYRERTYKRQLQMGIIPEGTQLTPRDKTLDSWDSIPENQRPFQRRLMEVFAGFVEHTDVQVGHLLQGLEDRGLKENTLVIYIFGDNGSSSEGQNGTVSELLAQNNIASKVEEHITALNKLGGLDALGGPKLDSMYHAGWAWAGSTPFKGTKLLGSYFGGTRNPMVIAWPDGIKPDSTLRSQFLHVTDIAPTIYEILEIKHPTKVNGYEQIVMDGVSFVYTFEDATAKGKKQTQFFDNNGSRGIYHEGWFAGTFGPYIPWNSPLSAKTLPSWDSAEDVWELYKLADDFSQANDLATVNPKKLKQMKALFMKVAEENKDFPIGAGNWLRIHPGDRAKSPFTSWEFTQNTRRLPEFDAPGLGRESNRVVVNIDAEAYASGVLYALGGAGGGLTLYMDEGYLVYEYNLFIIHQFTTRSEKPLTAGKHRIEVETRIPKIGGPAEVVITVDGKEVARTTTTRTAPTLFTASETLDIGIDLGSPVSMNYYDRRPFAFEGLIEGVKVNLIKSK
ncbi:MAG: arylsulfatase [Pontiella sp.]